MTAKEFFEIEPIQKNSLLVFVFVFFISFLQLYIFKEDFNDEKDLTKFLLTMSVSIFWVTAELPTYFFFVNSRRDKYKLKGLDFNLFLDRIIISFGFTLIIWTVLLTYIGYEFDFDLKTFIRVSLSWMFIKSSYWFSRWLVYYFKTKNK